MVRSRARAAAATAGHLLFLKMLFVIETTEDSAP
jgi:hypothetical protein